jgi:hypothetical protein
MELSLHSLQVMEQAPSLLTDRVFLTVLQLSLRPERRMLMQSLVLDVVHF